MSATLGGVLLVALVILIGTAYVMYTRRPPK